MRTDGPKERVKKTIVLEITLSCFGLQMVGQQVLVTRAGEGTTYGAFLVCRLGKSERVTCKPVEEVICLSLIIYFRFSASHRGNPTIEG